MNARWIKILSAGMAMAAGAWFGGGCEDAVTDTALGVTPAKSEIMDEGTTVYMTAYDPDEAVYDYSEVYEDEEAANKASVDSSASSSTNFLGSQILLPLEWRVSNGALGRIASSAGYSAIYESYGGKGQNYVTVEDQFGRQGVAVVEQRTTDTTNVVTTTETSDVDAETTYVITTNGTVITTNVVVTISDSDEEEDVTTTTSTGH